MKYEYTAILEKINDNGEYCCRVPDLPGCVTTGDGLGDAIEMVNDAAGEWLIASEDDGMDIPCPTSIEDMDIPGGAIITIVQVDTDQRRKQEDTEEIPVTINVPKWMVYIAQREGVNLSKVLQKGLLKKLNK